MKKIILSFYIFLFLVIFVSAQTNKLFCYYGSWATYREGNGKVAIENINPKLCTHYIYAFLGLNTDGTIKILDSWNDVTNKGFEKFVALKKSNLQAKILVAIGGWNEGSEKYSKVVNSKSLRGTFVNNIVSFITKYNFDGFDIDWEYPGQRGGASSDRSAYVELLKELRPKFNQHKLILTAAVGTDKNLITTSYDVPNLSKYLDYINLMTYDFHGSSDGVTGQNAPLYASSKDQNKNLNADSAVKNWIQAGANPKKLILGIALYGRSFTLKDSQKNSLGSPTSGPGAGGRYTKEPGILTYLEICEQQKSGGWTTKFDNEQKTPYTYKGNQWVGYDNLESVKIKANYAINKKLGGVMVWSIDHDDTRNSCGTGSYPLLSAISKIIKK